jgi:hypothetical protein
MTQDEIIDKLLFQAGAHFGGDGINYEEFDFREFAKLVAAKAFQNGYEKGIAGFNEAVSLEREACEKACEHQPHWVACAAAIRARGEQE